MPHQDLIFNTALFAVAGLLLALVTIWLAPGQRKAMLIMTLIMVAGMLGLAAWSQAGGALAGTMIVAVLRELAVVLVAVGFALALLAFLFQGVFARKAVPRILADVMLVLLLIAFVLYRMKAVGVNLASIITTSAVLTGVIAFSLQETLGNLWGGIALQLDNTCRLGDWIRTQGVTGQIVSIRWRYLAVATNNGETVILPNAQLMKNHVMVLARRGDARIPWRRQVEFAVAYDVPPSKVIAAVEAALARAEIPFVAPEPGAAVHLCRIRRTIDQVRRPLLARRPRAGSFRRTRRSAPTCSPRSRATTWKCRCRGACCSPSATSMPSARRRRDASSPPASRSSPTCSCSRR